MPLEPTPDARPARRSYRLGKRRDSIDRTRERILAAATELFSGPTPARISIDHVATRAGVSRATVYYQFKSRSDLLNAVVLAALPIARMAELVVLREQPDARDAACAYVHEMAHIWDACGPVVANVNALSAIDREARLLSAAYDEQRRQALIGVARRLGDQEYLRSGIEVELAAEVMWWLTSIATFDHLRRRSGLAVGAVAATLVAMLEMLLRDRKPA